MFDRAAGVHIVAHDLSGIVDAAGLSPSGAGEVYVAEGAAILGEAVPHAAQVVVRPHDQPRAVDARSDAHDRTRDGENLVDSTREGERGRACAALARIETEPAHCGGAVAVENNRLRGARIVDARKRVDLG